MIPAPDQVGVAEADENLCRALFAGQGSIVIADELFFGLEASHGGPSAFVCSHPQNARIDRIGKLKDRQCRACDIFYATRHVREFFEKFLVLSPFCWNRLHRCALLDGNLSKETG